MPKPSTPNLHVLPAQATDTISRLEDLIEQLQGAGDLPKPGAYLILTVNENEDICVAYNTNEKVYALLGAMDVLKSNIIADEVKRAPL